MVEPALYLDAVRHLRARQVLTRGRRLVPPAALALGLRADGSPAWRPIAAGLGVNPAPASGPTEPPSERGEFIGFGASRSFPSAAFWEDESDGLQFLFHLHGFGTLADYAAGPRDDAGDEFWGTVVESWLVSEGRPRLPGWHPYPTSLRIVAWCSALAVIDTWSGALRERVAREIWRQVRYLRRAVEHDIGGNHVLKNACALVTAGSVFSCRRLADYGLRLLQRELGRQILADGGHEERSTAYHREIAADLADLEELVARAGDGQVSWLTEHRKAMEEWSAAIAGPDGGLPLLNDAWEGPARSERSLDSTEALTASGYFVMRHGDDQLVFDAGPLGPRHLPAHAHADALSFVLWDDGRPLVIDPGSYAYTGPWRDPFRGTGAHNTVEIDGESQCEFFGDFRAGRLPDVRAQPLRRHGEVVVAAGSHDGYRRLSDPVRHERSLVWCPGTGVVVVDLLRARRPHDAGSALRLAPGAPVDSLQRVGSFRLSALGSAPGPTLHEAPYAPFMGTRLAATAVADRRQVAPEEPFGWALLRPPLEVAALTRERLTLAGPGERTIEIPLVWT